jgi:hypothetical protein
MKIFGLGTDFKIKKYLSENYKLDVSNFYGVPVYIDKNISYLGGYKGFYSLLVVVKEDNYKDIITNYFMNSSNVVSYFSVNWPKNNAAIGHYLLNLNKSVSVNNRFDLYQKKTRNQVRKSYLTNFDIDIGNPPSGFYELYASSMKRLGGITKDRSYFECLERFMGNSIVCISIFDRGQLIGCNYLILSGTYIMLMFNVSNERYWSYYINDRLYDELIVWAIKNSIDYVDFGPGVKKDLGHNHFKAGFGATWRPIINIKQLGLLIKIRLFIGDKKRNFHLRFLKLLSYLKR